MAVKIIIRRRIPKGNEAQVLPLLLDLRAKAMTHSGYISGETLRNVNNPEDYVIISTWKSVESWKAWEASKERAEILSKVDSLLGAKTEYGIFFHG